MVVMVIGAPFTNRGQGYGFATSVCHPRSDSVGLLVYDAMRTISEAPLLYYRSLRTAPNLSEGINILSRPYRKYL
jgi:hypothetical protein